jgi:hypothetical protein
MSTTAQQQASATTLSSETRMVPQPWHATPWKPSLRAPRVATSSHYLPGVPAGGSSRRLFAVSCAALWRSWCRNWLFSSGDWLSDVFGGRPWPWSTSWPVRGHNDADVAAAPRASCSIWCVVHIKKNQACCWEGRSEDDMYSVKDCCILGGL